MLSNVMYCSLSYLLCQIVHLSNIKCGFSELYCNVLYRAVQYSVYSVALYLVLYCIVLCCVVSSYALTPIDSNCAFLLQNDIIMRFILPLYTPLHSSSSAFYHF